MPMLVMLGTAAVITKRRMTNVPFSIPYVGIEAVRMVNSNFGTAIQVRTSPSDSEGGGLSLGFQSKPVERQTSVSAELESLRALCRMNPFFGFSLDTVTETMMGHGPYAHVVRRRYMPLIDAASRESHLGALGNDDVEQADVAALLTEVQGFITSVPQHAVAYANYTEDGPCQYTRWCYI